MASEQSNPAQGEPELATQEPLSKVSLGATNRRCSVPPEVTAFYKTPRYAVPERAYTGASTATCIEIPTPSRLSAVHEPSFEQSSFTHR